MISDKPEAPLTQLYAIEVHEARSGELYHVISHPVRAKSPETAVWETLRVYAFRIKYWRLQAVPAHNHFQTTEAAA